MKSKTTIILFFVAGCFVLLNSCKKDLSAKSFSTKVEQLLITQYLENEGGDSLQTIIKLIKKAGRYNILNAYGNNTFFVPTDKAFTTYLASIGKASVDELDSVQARNIVDYHIIINKITLQALNIGMIEDTTVNGLKLLYTIKNGDLFINKVYKVLKPVELSNGMVYILDGVLDPPAANIYDYLASTGKFTIMKRVFDETGLKDTLQTLEIKNPYTDLNYPIPVSFTLFIESDDVLKSKGITSFDALKQSVSDSSKSWTASADTALYAFARYHLMQGVKFLFQMFPNDNINQDNLVTLALNRSKVIHTNGYLYQTPILNAYKENAGISFYDALSDKIVKNGVIHQLDGILYIPNQIPPTVYVKRECEHGFRRYYTSGYTKYVFLQDARISNGSVGYTTSPQFSTDENDIFGSGAAVVFTPNDIGDYIEFDIKDLVPGKYNIKLNYQRDLTYASRNVYVYFWKSSVPFDIKSQPICLIDMADQNNTINDPYYNQKRLLTTGGPFEVNDYGDYTIRFAHADRYYGTYDAILFEPVN